MNKSKQKKYTLASLLILHLGVAMKLIFSLKQGNYLIVAGIVFLSMIYVTAGYRQISKQATSEKKKLSALIIFHLNLFITLYTILFLFFSMQELFLVFAFLSLISALVFVMLVNPIRSKHFERKDIIKAGIFNLVVVIGLITNFEYFC